MEENGKFVIYGTIEQIMPQVSGTKNDKQWTKDSFLLGFKSGQYDEKLYVEWFSSKHPEYGQFVQPGAFVKVTCRVSSREWNGRYFTGVNMAGIEFAQYAPQPQYAPQGYVPQGQYAPQQSKPRRKMPPQPQGQAPVYPQPAPPNAPSPVKTDDDLPF